MTTLLTLYYTVCTAVLLAAASGLLYWSISRSLVRADEDFLTHKMQVLTLILQRQPLDRVGLEQEVLDEARISARSRSPFLLRVLGADGRLLTETPGMNAITPVQAFPPAGARPAQARRIASLHGKTLLLAALSLPGPPGDSWRVQAALDIDADMRLLRRYRRDVAALLCAGLLLAAGLGAWIARRGLRPIADITRTTQRIGAKQLQERLRPGAWPRELMALATEFDDMLERLQEAFERLTQFSADLAHELRTPINNLMGEAQVALSRERTAAEYERVLQSALEEHGRLARMIDSMLFLAQADQERLPLQRTPLAAEAELHAIAGLYQDLAEEQGVQLSCEGTCPVQADPLLLRRALSNLVSNALRYTPRGGRITLRAATDEAGTAALSVTDTGIGIAAEHVPSLGQRFYRVDPSRSAGAGGAGLGLAIVRSIMTLHGGRLVIQSSPGTGTTASLLFPPVRVDDHSVIFGRSLAEPELVALPASWGPSPRSQGESGGDHRP